MTNFVFTLGLILITGPLHLDIDQAVSIALSKNLTLKQSKVQATSSKVSFYESLTGYLPQPSIQISYSNTKASIPLSQPGLPPIYTYTNKGYQVYLSLDQSLFDPDRLLSVWEQRNQKRYSYYELSEKERDIVLQVKSAYFNALKTRRIIEERKKALERARENLDFVQMRYNLGSASRVDLLNAKVEKGQAELNLEKAKADKEMADRTLLNLLGIEERVPLELEEVSMPEPEPEIPPFDSLLEIALRERPLMKGAGTSLSSAKANFWYSTLTFLPRVSFGWYSSYGSEEKFPNSFRELWDNSTRSSGIYLSINFNFTSYPFYVINSRYNWKSQELSYKLTRLEVIKDIEDAYRNLKTAMDALKQARLIKAQAEEALKLAKGQYQLGSISSLELFDAESRFLEAELSWISTFYDYYIAKESLNRAIGLEVIR